MTSIRFQIDAMFAKLHLLNKPFFAPLHRFCRPPLDPNTLWNINSIQSTWPNTVNIDDNDRGLHFETVSHHLPGRN